jgi:hypothetical protein
MLVTNPALGFREGRPKKLLYLCSGNLGRFSRQGHRKINKLSLLEPGTGNFYSLIPQKISLLFLSLDDLPRRVKHSESWGMHPGALREWVPKP